MTRIALIAGGTRPDRPARTVTERQMPAVRAQVFLPSDSAPGEATEAQIAEAAMVAAGPGTGAAAPHGTMAFRNFDEA